MPQKTDRVLLVIGDERLLIDPGKLLLGEIVAVEKATGLAWPQLWGGLNLGEARSIQAMVWMMRKRSNPRLRLAEVEFAMGEYQLTDPDYDPEYWIPEGDDDRLPGQDDAEQETEQETYPEGPKAERPQDTPPVPEE